MPSLEQNSIEKTTKAEAIQLLDSVPAIMSNILSDYMALGIVLKQIKDGKLYIHSASHLKTFDDYCKDVKIGRSTAYNCMAISSRFENHVYDSGKPIDYTRLVQLLPYDSIDDKEWIEKAAGLPKSGWDAEIAALSGGKDHDVCDHGDYVVIKVCNICKKRFKES